MAALAALVPFAAPELRPLAERVWLAAGPASPAAEGTRPTGAPAPSPAPLPPAEPAREVTGSGFVIAPRTTTVFATYAGRIRRIFVAAGDRVAEGAPLIALTDAGADFALDQARLAVRSAELARAGRAIDLAQATTRLARIAALAAREATSRQALDDAQAGQAQAQNALAQADQAIAAAGLALRIAQDRVDALLVRAPFAGTVMRLAARIGDTVPDRADSLRDDQGLLTLSALGTEDGPSATGGLVIDADVAETQLAALRPGLAGQAVLDGFPDRPFAVTVVTIAPAMSAEKGTISLRLSLDGPPEGIRPNMAARIRLFLHPTGDNRP